jgi:hypothetical protein
VRIVERIAHVVPVGVRLIDVATGRPVADGVTVRLVPPRRGAPAIAAFRTPSGVFAAHGIARPRAWELRDVGDDGELVDVVPEPVVFRVEVRDGSGRFHSFAVDDMRVPFEAGGPLSPPDSPPGSPPDGDPRELPLYSAPSRPVPPGMAAVRARLVHASDRRPAGWAALEVDPRSGGVPFRGVADARGEVLVLFPYPPPGGLVLSPPSGTKRSLTDTVWTIGLRAFLPHPGSPPEPAELPELRRLVEQVPTTLTTTASTPVGEATLRYGRELVLRSPDDAVLLVGA